MERSTGRAGRARGYLAVAGAWFLWSAPFVACSTDGGSHPRKADAAAGGNSAADGGPGSGGTGSGKGGSGHGSGGLARGGNAGAGTPRADAEPPDATPPSSAPDGSLEGGSLEGGSLDGAAPHGGTVGASGGTLAGPDGMSVTVPSGALNGDTAIDIERVSTDPPNLPPGMALLGPIYALTPHGVQFAKPVTVRLPFDTSSLPGAVAPLLLQAEPGGTFAPIEAHLDGGDMTATVSSFSYFAVARIGNIAAGDEFTCAMAPRGARAHGRAA